MFCFHFFCCTVKCLSFNSVMLKLIKIYEVCFPQIVVHWIMTQCSLGDGYELLERSLVSTSKTAWWHNPEDHNQNTNHF
jgi:hypothetical protein